MATFAKIRNFWGTDDGWRARGVIQDIPADSWNPIFKTPLEDLDRGATYGGTHVQANHPAGREHIDTDDILNGVNVESQKHDRLLLLHTWNIDCLTGVNFWEGLEFGAMFQRMI